MLKEKKVIKNSVSLYIMTFVRMVFPLLTLPYLTRVLSYESYGMMNYVNAVMTYIRLIIDFGFLLSTTAEIARYRGDKKKIGYILGNVMAAKILLSMVALALLLLLCLFIPILRENFQYVIFSFMSNTLSIFLLDFFFQGIEEMHILTIRFVIMQSVATVLTFFLVHGDQDLLLIPVLNLIATGIAAGISLGEILFKYKIKLGISCKRDIWHSLKNAFVFWISDISSTAFTALNTLLIGAFLPATEVALWSISLQIIIVLQRLYSPISNSIYPYMIREPKIKFIKKILTLCLPLVFTGCVALWFLADIIMNILGGEKYLAAVPILRALLPLAFISFPALLFGWPVLGAIGKEKETSMTTVIAAFVQVVLILLLIATGKFTIINIACSRAISEGILLVTRLGITYRFRTLFKDCS